MKSVGAGAALFDSMASSRKTDSSGVRASDVEVPDTTSGCGAGVTEWVTLLFLRAVPMFFYGVG